MSFVDQADLSPIIWGDPEKPDTDAVDRIQVVDRYGRIRSEISEFNLGDLTWEVGVGPSVGSFSASPFNKQVMNLPIATRDVEIFITTSIGEEWWGIPTDVTDGDPSSMTFALGPLRDLLKDRYIDRSSAVYTSLATTEIMRQLVFYAQSEAHQKYRFENIWPRTVDINFVPGERWSSVRRSRKYERNQHQSILDCLDEFAGLDKPITSDVGSWSPPDPHTGQRKRYMNLTAWYQTVWPLAFPLVFSQETDGSNIESFGSYSEKGSDIANDIYETGGTSGNVQFEAHETDQASAARRGLRTAIESSSDVLDVDWLGSKARQSIAERKDPEVTFDINLITVPSVIGKVISPGSIWPVHIFCGRIQVHANFRIISKTYTPGNRNYNLKLQAVDNVLAPYNPAFSWSPQL